MFILNCCFIDHDLGKFPGGPSVAGLDKAKFPWNSSSCWRDRLAHKNQLRIPVPELSRETSLHPHDRIDWHLCGAAFVVGPLGIGRLPLHAELGERLVRRAREAILAVEDRLTGELGDNRPAV